MLAGIGSNIITFYNPGVNSVKISGVVVEENSFVGVAKNKSALIADTVAVSASRNYWDGKSPLTGSLMTGDDIEVKNYYATRNSFTGFTNDGQFALQNQSGGGLLQAPQNWFDSATGPIHSSNPGGIGALVDGDVNLSPWLGDGTDTDETIGFQPNLSLASIPTCMARRCRLQWRHPSPQVPAPSPAPAGPLRGMTLLRAVRNPSDSP